MNSMKLKDKLKNISKERNVDFNTLLRLYMYDRFIESNLIICLNQSLRTINYYQYCFKKKIEVKRLFTLNVK